MAAAGASCPLCGQCVDRWGDHALLCSCGGDRTIRHNAVRNICFEEAAAAGCRPEREKAGLLPQRPQEDGLPTSRGARRPADVWLPRGVDGEPEALDFAVTSGMQAGLLRNVMEEPGYVFMRYEDFKQQHLRTAEQCQTAGFQFTPLVFEAHAGGFSGKARHLIEWLARAAAAAHHAETAAESLRIAQRISITLQRETARAVLRRLSCDAPEPGLSGWAPPADGTTTEEAA